MRTPMGARSPENRRGMVSEHWIRSHGRGQPELACVSPALSVGAQSLGVLGESWSLVNLRKIGKRLTTAIGSPVKLGLPVCM
jgi:hypothetical protein